MCRPSQGTNIKYAFIGNADRCPASCAAQTVGPNNTTGADAMASVISHELEESVTDPNLNAWYDSAGNENADKCAWTFGTTYTTPNGAKANMFLGGRDYLIQRNWVNASGGYCALSYSGTPDFTVSGSPASQTVAPGAPAAYTVTIAPTNGFSSAVTLSVTGLPSGATAGFSTNPATASSTLTVSTTSGTPVGTYSLTITGTSGSLSHTGAVTLRVALPPDFAVSASPPGNTVIAGAGAGYTVTITALNGFAGTTGFSVSGMPSGVTSAFSPVTVAGGGSSTMTLSTAAAMSPGTYPLVITATSGILSHTANVNLTVTAPASGGSLAASIAAPTGPVDLSQLGGSDWAHWGLTAATDFDHKAAVTSKIPNFAVIGSGAVSRYANNSVGFTWTDGTPTATATNTTTGVFISGQNNGFRLTVPADPTVKTLLVYVGAWHTQLKMVAQLSDGSAPTFTDTSLTNSVSPTSLAVYTFTYSAASAGQTLTISLTQNLSGFGNVTLQAAALSGGVPVPDFSLAASPAGQTIAAGQSAPYTATVTALNGFSGSVGLSVSGLPSGVTAAFSPGNVSGSGSSTMTLTTAANAVAGVYPLTVTGTSGALTHTASVSLTITDFSLSASPASRTVVAGQNASYTATVTALSGFGGSVGLSVSGLPPGVTAAFSPGSVSGSGSSTMTLTVAGTTAAGVYPLTVAGASGALTHTGGVSLTVTQAATGSLTGSMTPTFGPVQLTQGGTLDWAHWGLATATDYDHKASVTPRIGNFSTVGSGSVSRYANNSAGFTWTDGTPATAATNTTTGVFVPGQNNGFRLTVPADTTVRTLNVYVGAWHTQLRMVVHLSDNSAPDYIDTSLVNTVSPTSLGVYTLTYHAASAGQTLTVTLTQDLPGTGNVTLQAATMQ